VRLAQTWTSALNPFGLGFREREREGERERGRERERDERLEWRHESELHFLGSETEGGGAGVQSKKEVGLSASHVFIVAMQASSRDLD
jgi:hypothetical protein